MADRRWRVGLVGYGFAGRGFHAYLMGRVPRLELVAVVSRTPERRAQAEHDHHVATFASLENMIHAKELDLVVVATPHDTHLGLVTEAVRAGKHCVVDKVMSLTAGEAQQMIDEAARNAVKLSVFQNRRWDWDFLTVKSVLAQGWLGNPYLLESAVMRFRPPRGWRADATSSGGILFDWGAHLVDQALVLVPSAVVSVSCAIQKRAWGADIGSYARVLLRFSNGVLYAIEVGNLSRYERPRWLVLGDRGSFVKTGLDPQEPAMLRGAIDQAQESAENQAELRVEANGLVVRSRLESVRGDWTDYYRNVADALDGKAELAVKPEECLRAMRVLDAAMDASRLGRSLDVHI